MRIKSKFKFRETKLFNRITFEPYISKLNIWNDRVVQKIKIFGHLKFFKRKDIDKTFTKITQYKTDEIIINDCVKKFDIKIKNVDNIHIDDDFTIKEITSINIGENNND